MKTKVVASPRSRTRSEVVLEVVDAVASLHGNLDVRDPDSEIVDVWEGHVSNLPSPETFQAMVKK